MSDTRAAALAAAFVLLMVLGCSGSVPTALAAGPAPAAAAATSAADPDIARYLALIEPIRQQLIEVRELYAAGESEGAFRAARSAYLDSFELVEIPLRVRDPNMTLEMEDAFARLRNDIRAARPLSVITDDVSRLLTGMNEVERVLSVQGFAPVVVAGSALVIVLRTGFEAMVLVAAVLGFLAANRASAGRRAVLAGVAAAIGATVATWFVLDLILLVAPIRPALVQAVPGLVAVGLTVGFSYWLLRRLDQRRWLEFMSARVFGAVAAGSTGALFALGFATVFRQGFEAVVFFRTLREFAFGAEGWLIVGVLAGLGALLLLALLIARIGQRVPVRAVLAVSVVVMMLVSIAFVGNAVRALQEGYVIGITNLTASVPRLPIHLAQATGFHPTLETIVAQVTLAAVYVVMTAWTVRAARRGAVLQRQPA
jgi:high-affinity iron transporter